MAALTIPQVAERLGVSYQRAWQLVDRRQLPARKVGRDWTVEEADLARMEDGGAMVTRRQQIRQIADIIREHEDALLAYGGDLTYAEVEATNRGGYTLEFAAPLGGVLRQEGVVLDADELRRAWELAHAPARS